MNWNDTWINEDLIITKNMSVNQQMRWLFMLLHTWSFFFKSVSRAKEILLPQVTIMFIWHQCQFPLHLPLHHQPRLYCRPQVPALALVEQSELQLCQLLKNPPEWKHKTQFITGQRKACETSFCMEKWTSSGCLEQCTSLPSCSSFSNLQCFIFLINSNCKECLQKSCITFFVLRIHHIH